MKKVYERPTMNVVKLKNQTSLLQASAEKQTFGVQSYNWHTEEEDE